MQLIPSSFMDLDFCSCQGVRIFILGECIVVLIHCPDLLTRVVATDTIQFYAFGFRFRQLSRCPNGLTTAKATDTVQFYGFRYLSGCLNELFSAKAALNNPNVWISAVVKVSDGLTTAKATDATQMYGFQ
jgi:hypothetical protein